MGMKTRAWIKHQLGVRAWIRNQRDELISHLAEQAGQQAANEFKPVIDRVIRYAKLAAWFGIAGFAVGLFALIGFLVVIFDVV
jgi:uncharacterized membrane-anchored protein